MKRIIDWLLSTIFGGILCIIFAPLIFLLLLLVLICHIPKTENTFLFRMLMWVDRFLKKFKETPQTTRTKLYFMLMYAISVALWVIILFVIF